MFDYFDDDADLLFEGFDFILESTKQDCERIESCIKKIFMHLLKYTYQSSRQSKSWYDTFNKEYGNIMKCNIKSTNVLNRIDLDKCYNIARKEAIKETNLPMHVFPIQRPYDWDINFALDIKAIIRYLKENYNKDATYNIDIDEYFKSKGYL